MSFLDEPEEPLRVHALYVDAKSRLTTSIGHSGVNQLHHATISELFQICKEANLEQIHLHSEPETYNLFHLLGAIVKGDD